MTHEKIILALGGYRQVADDLDVHPTTTFKWTRSGIPSARWVQIEALAKKKGKRGINLDVLAKGGPKR